MSVIDKLKEAGVEKVGNLHAPGRASALNHRWTPSPKILIDRSREADKLSRMVWLSLAAHAVLIAAVAFMPADWGSSVKDDQTSTMAISLGGAPGPRQGMTAISAKPVQQAAPNTVKPNEQAPPALAKPEMVEPLKTAKPQPKAVAKAGAEEERAAASRRTPTTGPGSEARDRAGRDRRAGACRSAGWRPAAAAAGTAYHRLRELLLSRISDHAGAARPAELAAEPGRRWHRDDQVHDSARRHDHRRRGREAKRALPEPGRAARRRADEAVAAAAGGVHRRAVDRPPRCFNSNDDDITDPICYDRRACGGRIALTFRPNSSSHPRHLRSRSSRATSPSPSSGAGGLPPKLAIAPFIAALL